MNSEHQTKLKKLLNLNEASEKLGVTPAVLLNWNEHNILKPTITPEGQIGYSEEQIDHFLGIKKFSQDMHLPSVEINSHYQDTSMPKVEESFSQQVESNADALSQLPVQVQKVANNASSISPVKPLYSMPALMVIALFFLSILVVFTESSFKSMPHKNTASDYELGQEMASQSPVVLGDIESKAKTLSQDDVFSKALGAVLGTNDNKNASPSTRLASDRKVFPADKDAYALTSGEDEDQLIDEEGNIKGELSEEDSIATALGGVGGAFGNASSNSQNNATNQWALLLAIALASGFLARKQLSRIFAKPHKETNKEIVRGAAPSNKLLEIDQKMDGTVVLYFQGKEFKISRPELYSESDHLIQKLLELTRAGAKEIDFQNLNNEDDELTTPLSKLVTRLGFVGIKRELFFPRTSKDRLLFRRYITLDDLSAMNLNAAQIEENLVKIA